MHRSIIVLAGITLTLGCGASPDLDAEGEPSTGEARTSLTAIPPPAVGSSALVVPSFSTAAPTIDIPDMHPPLAAAPLFVAAVATPHATVRIAPGAQVDLSGLERIPVAAGVQIVGSGSLLFTTTFPSALLVLGDDVRLTGVRVQGAMSDDPFSVVGQPDSNGVQVESSRNVEIDDCEIDHWRGSGVMVEDDGIRVDLAHADSVWVHDDFIHHNQHPTADTILPGGGHGAGYGVQVAHNGYALIERNIFDFNRHSIMGDGSADSGYLAYRNLILSHGGINSRETGFTLHTHALDMHGSETCKFLGLVGDDHNCGGAGEFMDIELNTVLYTAAASVKLRGTPSIGMTVANNVFAHGQDGAVEQNETGLHAWNNTYGLDASNEQRTCDFDGDGKADAFLATGITWWCAASSKGWHLDYIDQSRARAADVTLADVDGDGRCDVTADGITHFSSDGGFFTAAAPTGGSAVAVARSSDGRLALFGANGNNALRRLQARPGDASWTEWTAFDGRLTSVAAEANADGRLELFGVTGTGLIWHRWELAPGSDSWSPWPSLDGLLVSIAVARNADGRLEIFGTNRDGNVWHRWQVAPNSVWSTWERLDGQTSTVAAETNADGRIELVAVNGAGQIFHRTQTAPNRDAWTPWSQIDGLLTQAALARNADGRLELFGTNGAGMVFHRAQIAPGAAWGAWSRFDGANLRSGSMTAETNADGRVELFGVDRLGQVVHRWQSTATRWSAWQRLEGGLTRAIPNVVGMTQSAAIATLAAAGYSAVVTPYVDVSCMETPGIVASEDPPPGPALPLTGAAIPTITIGVITLPNRSECNG